MKNKPKLITINFQLHQVKKSIRLFVALNFIGTARETRTLIGKIPSWLSTKPVYQFQHDRFMPQIK